MVQVAGKGLDRIHNQNIGPGGFVWAVKAAGNLVVALAAARGFLCRLWEQEAHWRADRKCLGASLPVY